MSIERFRINTRCHVATIAALAAGCLYVWAGGITSDAGRAAVGANSVLVSVSRLDMSHLEPVHFGDWETPAALPPQ